MTEKRDYPIKFRRMYFQIKVKDIERAKKFYEDIFNFDISWYMTPEVGWCELNLPGDNPRLGLNQQRDDEEDKPFWGILTFDVEDLDETKRYLEGKNIETTEITDVPNMVSYFDIKDSEGNRIQIVADPRVTE
ncbi:MAG: VOC family protein [Candidatus Heimdallarchaeaceae archaeon]|jgi:predicted enzyme related to lactoylglutathione lyase